MIIARQSTARTVMVGPILDATGVVVTDGVIADLKISKNGGTPAALNGSATLTHRHTGHYSLALTATDLDTVGQAEVVIDDTVNGMPAKEITVIEETVYDLFWVASATGAVSVAAGGITALSLDATVQARLGIVAYGTAQSVTGTTIQLASASTFANDELLGAVVVITGGTTGVGQSRVITDYVGSTDTATVDAWTTTPTGTITYVIFAAAPASTTALPDVNIKKINSVTIIGDGDATPFNVA